MIFLDFTAFLSTTIFFGVCLYVSLVEQPARLVCDLETALNQWRPSYEKAAVLQIILSVTGVISSIVLYFLSKEVFILYSGVILLTIAPVTLVFMKSCIKQLSDPDRTVVTPGTLSLLKEWGNYHLLRTLISLVALIFQILHMVTLMR